MSGIFISYRRSDIGSYAAGRLYDALGRRFGREHVFMDIDSLKGHAGLDFSRALDQAVTTCDVMLALIGPEWLAAVDDQGTRRLDDPEDWIRREIATALARSDIRVIPVLMGETSMPRSEQLPESLKPLARRQSVEVSEHRWDYDVEQLIDNVLGPLVRKPTRLPNRRMVALSLVAVAASGGAVAAAVWLDDDPEESPVSTPEPTRTLETPEATATQVSPTKITGDVPTAPTATATSPPEEPTPTATLGPTGDIGEREFAIGESATISNGGIPLLDNPSNTANVLRQLYYGDGVWILDGPIRWGGSTWWEVSVDFTGETGYVNEMFLGP